MARHREPQDADANLPDITVWQHMRQSWLSNRVFDSYVAIIDAACDAWQNLPVVPKAHQLKRNARPGIC